MVGVGAEDAGDEDAPCGFGQLVGVEPADHRPPHEPELGRLGRGGPAGAGRSVVGRTPQLSAMTDSLTDPLSVQISPSPHGRVGLSLLAGSELVEEPVGPSTLRPSATSRSCRRTAVRPRPVPVAEAFLIASIHGGELPVEIRLVDVVVVGSAWWSWSCGRGRGRGRLHHRHPRRTAVWRGDTRRGHRRTRPPMPPSTLGGTCWGRAHDVEQGVAVGVAFERPPRSTSPRQAVTGSTDTITSALRLEQPCGLSPTCLDPDVGTSDSASREGPVLALDWQPWAIQSTLPST